MPSQFAHSTEGVCVCEYDCGCCLICRLPLLCRSRRCATRMRIAEIAQTAEGAPHSFIYYLNIVHRHTDTQIHTYRHRRGSNERAYTTCKCIHLVIVRYSKCLCKCKRVCNALHSVTNEALFHLRVGSRQTVALHEGFSRARAQYIVCQMETTTLYAYLLSVRHCHCNVSCVRSLH